MSEDTQFQQRLKEPTSPAHAARVWWPVILRSSLYFFIPFLGTMGAWLIANAERPINWFMLVGNTLISIGGGLVAMRGYLDEHSKTYSDRVNGEGFPPPVVSPISKSITTTETKTTETKI